MSDLDKIFSENIRRKFELHGHRNAVSVLSRGFPEQFSQITDVLESFEITTEMIRSPGGSKGPVAKYVETLFSEEWKETRITADLHVRLVHAGQQDEVLNEYVKQGYPDGHRIDFVSGEVALDLEWNSKDQTYDRDLYAFSAFYEAGAIDAGIILTRGVSPSNDFFRSLGKVLKKDGTEGTGDVYKKFGASTTWTGKLTYRLDAGRNGGCPVLAIGIKQECIK